MMTQLTWSALIFAALGVLACWNHEESPVCQEGRPVFGARPCCQRHRTTGNAAFNAVAKLEAARRSIPDRGCPTSAAIGSVTSTK
jgi:hypothetical protein